MDYDQSAAKHHPNLVLKFAYLKDMSGVYPLNISVVGGGKESEQVKGGVDATAVITYKTSFVTNAHPVTASIDLGEGVSYNTLLAVPANN